MSTEGQECQKSKKKDAIKWKMRCEKHTSQGEIVITCRFRSLENKARYGKLVSIPHAEKHCFIGWLMINNTPGIVGSS